MIKKKVADIQIFRALAIIYVLLQHLSLTATLSEKFPVRFSLPFYIGVELFFVVSGYVVAKSFFSGDTVNPVYFFAKRIFRIYPTLIAFIIFSFLVNLLLHALNLPSNLAQMFVISWNDFVSFSTRIILGILINQQELPNTIIFGAMWSLSVEFQFYAFITLAGLVLVFLVNKKNLEWIFLIFCTLVYLLINIYRIIFLFTVQKHGGLIGYIINFNFDFLFLGFAVALAEKKGLLTKLLPISRELSLSLSSILLIVPLALVAISEPVLGVQKRILQGFSLPISGLCFALLIYLASTVGCFPGTKTRLYRFLYRIGDRSYSLYLFHFPVIMFVWVLLYKLYPNAFSTNLSYGIYQLIITLILLFPIVESIYFYIEEPFILYSHKFLQKAKSIK